MGNRAGSSPVARTKHKREAEASLLCLVKEKQDLNPSKCNADERCRRRLDGAEPYFSPTGRKCKSSPVARTKNLTIDDTIRIVDGFFIY